MHSDHRDHKPLGRERLVFQHIAKCAGTTVDSILRSNFLESEICPIKHDTLFQQNGADLKRYRYFSGHFSKFSIDAIPSPKRVITILREPRSRILSLYYFWKSHRVEVIERLGLSGPRVAKELELVKFLQSTSDPVSLSVNNHMTRVLIGHLARDQYTHISNFEPDFIVQNAVLNLQRYFFIGLTEHLDRDLRTLLDLLGFACPSHIPLLNSAVTTISTRFEPVVREVVNEDIYRELDRLTTLDRRLYESVRSISNTMNCSYFM